MDRLACVDVVQLPLQILLRSRPEWAKHPSAVVAEDKPQGVLLFANEAARENGILPGQRYAAALGLCAELRAAVVGATEIEHALAEIEALLASFTPGIERSRERPGVFWLDAHGLSLIEPSLPDWARRIGTTLKDARFHSRIALGFRRFATFAAAETRRDLVVFDDPEAELRFLHTAPIARLDVDPKLRDELARLGVHFVGDFAALPEEGVRARFGVAAERLHRLVNDRSADPFQPATPKDALERRLAFEEPLTDANSLLFFLRPLLEELLAEMAARGQALAEFSFRLDLEHGPPHEATLRPASPSLKIATLLQLATLHFERSPLEPPPTTPSPSSSNTVSRRGAHRPNSIEALHLTATGVTARPEQLSLFHDHPRRDLKAGDRALALVRSRFGDLAVGRFRMSPGHLPEASFQFEPIPKLDDPHPAPALERTAVRRIFAQPIAVSPPRRHPHDDGWIIHDLKQGTVTKTDGPYVISGGWWAREVHREYRFVHTLSGDVLWVFYDKKRRRWYLHGQLE